MKYQKIKKYKYRVKEFEILQIDIYGYNIEHEFFELNSKGILTIYPGYLWDGVSGPAIDTKNTRLAGLVHDVLYQMIRLELILPSDKEIADKILRKILLSKGMSKFRAWYYYQAVDKFGKYSCIPGDTKEPEVLEA